jgi:hypothetical protein
MKIIEFKTGTREEIIQYLREKVKKTFKVDDPKRPWFKLMKGEIYEFFHNTIENQIDTFIESGSPLVSVHLPSEVGDYREQFIVSDFSECKVNMELKKIENNAARKARLEAAAYVLKMEEEAKKRNKNYAKLTSGSKK